MTVTMDHTLQSELHLKNMTVTMDHTLQSELHLKRTFHSDSEEHIQTQSAAVDTSAPNKQTKKKKMSTRCAVDAESPGSLRRERSRRGWLGRMGGTSPAEEGRTRLRRGTCGW
jgi:hypothetical protein